MKFFIVRLSSFIFLSYTQGDSSIYQETGIIYNSFTGKTLWELIEPCEKRIQFIQQFIQDVDSSVEYEVVPISDMYGPTKSDPNLNMIVVSTETEKGGIKVNDVRKQNGLSILEICKIDLVQDLNHGQEEEDKLSSSNARMRLLGTYMKEPEVC